MKKIFVALMASVLMLVSCAKDNVSKVIFKDSLSVENVTYSMNIEQAGDGYSWTVVNSGTEVTTRYTYNYDSKKYLCQDFANVARELNQLDDTVLGTLLPVFTYDFNFIDDPNTSAVVTRTVVGGVVFVKFAFAGKVFSVPYSFITGANVKLNPEQE